MPTILIHFYISNNSQTYIFEITYSPHDPINTPLACNDPQIVDLKPFVPKSIEPINQPTFSSAYVSYPFTHIGRSFPPRDDALAVATITLVFTFVRPTTVVVRQ